MNRYGTPHTVDTAANRVQARVLTPANISRSGASKGKIDVRVSGGESHRGASLLPLFRPLEDFP
jgi:hypothetical protein